MRRLSAWTKYLGIPSLAGLALGLGLLWYSGNAGRRYNNFIEETSRTPIVRQVYALDNSLGDLFDSEKALTYYMVNPVRINPLSKVSEPAIYHSPNVDESLGKLDSARNNLTQGAFPDSHDIRALDDQIRLMKNEVSRTERGKSEEFYETQRIQIQGLQERSEFKLNQLKKEVPPYIFEKRESLLNQSKRSSTAGWLFTIFGAIGTASYGVIRLLVRYIES